MTAQGHTQATSKSTATRSYTTAQLCERVGGQLEGRNDLEITGVNAMADAKPGQISYITKRKFAEQWNECSASAALVSRDLTPAGHDAASRALIYVDDAALAIIDILELFAPLRVLPEIGVHPTAHVHPQAALGGDVRIGPHVSVDRGARIGDDVVLHAGVRIGADAVIGEQSELHANCVIGERCVIGAGVTLQHGVSIGSDGFGYHPVPNRELKHVPHIGNVVLGDNVEIGSNSCVDRAKFESTTIGEGTKIDNLVQIAHNCRVGRWCVIAGQAGLAGSVRVGDYVQIGAQTGVAEGVTIGERARIGAKSGVMRDVPAGAAVVGMPAEDGPVALRQAAALRKLPELLQELKRRRATTQDG